MGRKPDFSRIRLCLQTPGLPKLREKSPKISGPIRKFSRFAETIGGDLVRPRLPVEGGIQFCGQVRFEQRPDSSRLDRVQGLLSLEL
jgi:hypothetical protein